MPDQLTKRNTTPAPATTANRPVPTRSTANTRSSASTEQAKVAQPSSLIAPATPQSPSNRPVQGAEEQAGQLKGQNIHQGIGRLNGKGNGIGSNAAADNQAGNNDAEILKSLDTHSAQKAPPVPASWIVRLLEIAEQRGEAGRKLLADEIAREVSQEWAKSVAATLSDLPVATTAQSTQAAITKPAPVPGSVGQKNQAAQPLTAPAPRTAQMQLEVPGWLETDQPPQTQSKPTVQAQGQSQNTPKHIEQNDLAERQVLAQRAARILKATGLQTVTPAAKWLNLQYWQVREAIYKLTPGREPEDIRDWLGMGGSEPLYKAIGRVYSAPHLVGPQAFIQAGQQNAAALHVVMALWVEAQEPDQKHQAS